MTGAWWLWVAAAAGVCVLAAFAEFGRARLGLARRRRTADALLRTGIKVHPESELLTWRAAELTSDRNRTQLSRSLRGIVQELDRPAALSPVPLDRRRVRPHAGLVLALADHLGAFDRPVTAQGMVFVQELLADGYASPLFLGGPPTDVAVALRRCLAALDGPHAREDYVVGLVA
jgi:hypothetical protein